MQVLANHVLSAHAHNEPSSIHVQNVHVHVHVGNGHQETCMLYSQLRRCGTLGTESSCIITFLNVHVKLDYQDFEHHTLKSTSTVHVHLHVHTCMYMYLNKITHISLSVRPSLFYPPHGPHIVSVLCQLLHQLLETLRDLHTLKVQRSRNIPVGHPVLIRGQLLVGNAVRRRLAIAGADLVSKDDKRC